MNVLSKYKILLGKYKELEIENKELKKEIVRLQQQLKTDVSVFSKVKDHITETLKRPPKKFRSTDG